jgi:hypothetical protein
MPGRVVRFRECLALGLAVVLLFLGAGRGAVAIEAQRFGDGVWVGSLTGSGTVEFDSALLHTAFTSRWQGWFTLVADSGVVTDGQWSMDGNGISHVETEGGSAGGHATFVWAGRVGGEATAPKLGGQATMHMTVVGQSFDITLPREQTSSPQLEIYTSDCSRVTGDWTAGISNGIQDNGGESDITGPFIAFNTTGGPLTLEMATDFARELGVFEQHLLEGNFQHGELSTLILQAEQLEALLRISPLCAFAATPGTFAVFAYSVVRDLIDRVFAHPGDFDLDDLLFITRAAVRSGVLGAGAPDQDYARRTEEQLMNAFDSRLTLAIASGDRVAVAQIMELAVEMAWPTLVEKAGRWLNG